MQGRFVSGKPSSAYAPTVFADEPEAIERKVGNKAFAAVMTRLFAASRLRVVTIGSASRQRSRIVEADAMSAGTAIRAAISSTPSKPFTHTSGSRKSVRPTDDEMNAAGRADPPTQQALF